jgi:hypothetical protein
LIRGLGENQKIKKREKEEGGVTKIGIAVFHPYVFPRVFSSFTVNEAMVVLF